MESKFWWRYKPRFKGKQKSLWILPYDPQKFNLIGGGPLWEDKFSVFEGDRGYTPDFKVNNYGDTRYAPDRFPAEEEGTSIRGRSWNVR